MRGGPSLKVKGGLVGFRRSLKVKGGLVGFRKSLNCKGGLVGFRRTLIILWLLRRKPLYLHRIKKQEELWNH